MLNSISLKNKLFKQAKLNPGNHELWAEYLAVKRNSKRIIKASKRTLISSTLDNNRNDPERFWSEINKLLGAGKDSGKSLKTIMNNNGDIIGESTGAFSSHCATTTSDCTLWMFPMVTSLGNREL